MAVQIRGGNALNYRGDVLLLFHPLDIKPLTGTLALLDWRCNAAVSVLWKKKPDLFKFGQLTMLATQGKVPTETVIMTGLGSGEEFSQDVFLALPGSQMSPHDEFAQLQARRPQL